MDKDASPLEVSLAALDTLELAFAYIEGGAVRYLGARAAFMLGIRDRLRLEEHRELLEPLVECARSVAAQEGIELRRRNPLPPLSELVLQSAEHRTFKAVAVTRSFSTGSGSAGCIVLMQDLTALEPFFHTIEQSRRNRAALILGSSLSGRSLLFKPGGTDVVSVYRSVEDSLFKQQPLLDENVMQTDLLRGLSAAVDIVDPLLLPSSKIMVDVKTSALLRIGRPNFLRIVCHMLLEAADFVGPFGVSKVSAAFHAEGDTTGGGALGYHAVCLTVHAERAAAVPSYASPLELYIHRRFMPASYRVTVSESDDAASTATERQPLLPDEAFSENATIGVMIARQCGARSELSLPGPHSLLWRTYFPLYQQI